MKTVSIITINDFTNYGNRLQNLALSHLFELNGFKVINGLSYYTKNEWCKSAKNFWRRIIRRAIPFCIFKKRCEKNKLSFSDNYLKRYNSFYDYYSRFYTMESRIIAPNVKRVDKIIKTKGIDYFVVGSDQVWNPYFACLEYELLHGMPNEKKYSFAASFGVEQSDLKNVKKIAKNLNSFMYLSVREQSAVNIIKSITGRNATLTFDPTLLLSREEWKKFIQKPNFNMPDRYICTYFLGDVPREFLKFAKMQNLSVVPLNNEKNVNYFAANPGEFLHIIKNSEYVFTDSFHAVAFSIKFHRNFWVFKRTQSGTKNMFTRIESILNIFSLNDRIYYDEADLTTDIPKFVWKRIDTILDKAKSKTFAALKDAGLAP